MIDILFSTTDYLEQQLKTKGHLDGYYKDIEQELNRRKEQEQEFIEL